MARLPDDVREELRGKLEAMPDAELVGFLMATQKLAEQRSSGNLRHLLDAQTTVVAMVLDRFAPVAFTDALAINEEHYDEHEPSIVDEEDLVAEREAAEDARVEMMEALVKKMELATELLVERQRMLKEVVVRIEALAGRAEAKVA